MYTFRLCYYTTESLAIGKQKFLSEIRLTFGSGGFTCSLSERELVEFHNYLEDLFDFQDSAKMKQGVSFVGKQPAPIWILSPNVHISSYGEQIPVEESAFAWQPIGGPQIDLALTRSGSFDLQSEICLPLESATPLHNLLECLKHTLKHNFLSGTLF